jgi:hypothetical protein
VDRPRLKLRFYYVSYGRFVAVFIAFCNHALRRKMQESSLFFSGVGDAVHSVKPGAHSNQQKYDQKQGL